ncbi:MAG: type II secretory protein PulC [Sphingomonas sp.]|nr:type II secretory protein PulC [Sphingomonas sp.]
MQLEFDARARRIIRRVPRSVPYRLAGALLIAAVAVQAARLVWAIVTPIDAYGPWRSGVAGSAPEARAVLKSFDPFFRLDGPVNTGPAVVTSLQLTLFGTRIDDANGRGSAIIATADGVQKSYAVGEEIESGVKLKSVAFDHITLDRGGVDEDLFIDQSGGGAPSPGVSVPSTPAPATLPPQPGDSADSVSLSALRAGVGFIPRIDGGRVTGLVVRAQGTSGIFNRLGFRDGDVVTQLNGKPVSGIGDLDGLTATFGNGGNISVSVERGAEILPLVISVTGR